ncbi:histidine phosphatase family protein [Herbaspirillum aquaticum]|uniref:Phosphoglycerate mutase n=1 Tax=Herbaspirillum aquaticum TaxID=568783 RepID=A0A225SZQ7_9BURK|nr:histidine phosphatase family protein [Herbaspirillum aquaticum]OWY36485.1 phosphoglycerate mutase [Herbaspirillum aquaticum]
MRLHLVRHPQPLVDKSTCYGRSDIAVAPEMLAQSAAQLLPQLRALPHDWPLVSSPLQRCAKLAHSLAQAMHRPAPQVDPRLQEMDFGQWELRPWDDIPWAEVEAWNADLAHYAPGGGETLTEVAGRMWQAFDDLLATSAEGVIVICHAGSIRMLHACAAWRAGQGESASPEAADFREIALNAAAHRTEIPYARPLVLDVSPSPAR